MPEFTPAEATAILLSLKVASVAALASLPFGIAIGWLLARRRFFGKSLLDALVHLPLVVPPVVVGWGLLMLFGVRGPIGAPLHDWFGIRLVFTTDGAALASAAPVQRNAKSMPRCSCRKRPMTPLWPIHTSST